MEQQNQIQVAEKKQQIKAFEGIVNNAYYQNQLQKIFGANAGTFATSMMELYTSSSELHQCDPKLVAAEAMRAAALHLPLSKALGRAYVVVFKEKGVPKPQFLIGWRGLVDLAVRSCQYETINAVVVHKGELVGQDKLSGFVDINGQQESNEVVGYIGYFKLVSGFKKMFYMDVKGMCHYAKMYAPTLKFNKITEEELYNLAQEQSEKGPKTGSIGWFGDFNGMALKTVIRQVLKWGPMTIEMQQAIANDEETDILADAEEVRDSELAAPKETVSASQMMQDAEAVEVKEPEASEQEKSEEQPPI